MTKTLPPNVRKVQEMFPDKRTLTKADLAALISSETGESTRKAQAHVDRVLAAMSDALVAGKGLEFRGFGSFVLRKTSARPGRDPLTMVPHEIPARWKAIFRNSIFIQKMLQLSLS